MPLTASKAPPRPSAPRAPADLVLHNLGLARTLAHRFFRRRRRTAPLLLDDMMQDAMLGLTSAAHGYDPTRGVRFSTYAWTAIFHTILKALEQHDKQTRRQWTGCETEDVPEGAHSVAAIDHRLDQLDHREQLAPMLAALPGRLREVVRLRYGLDGGGDRTYSEVGAALRPPVTRQCAQQMMAQTMGMMKSVSERSSRRDVIDLPTS